MTSAWPLCDAALSRRLERTEASSNAAFVTARAALDPESGARWEDFDGAYAMFDGVGSPLTQTFGLGLFSDVSAASLERIDTFFESRGAAAFHEVSPLAPLELLAVLRGRGHSPVELTTVLMQPIGRREPRASSVSTRLAAAGEEESWAGIAASGWSDAPDVVEFVRSIGRVIASSDGSFAFFGEIDGQPVATGALWMHGGVALLAGASTVPHARGRGAQNALLEARLRFAAERGCDLAMMCTQPGSGSQRNAERQGFRVAYTRIKWGRQASRSSG